MYAPFENQRRLDVQPRSTWWICNPARHYCCSFKLCATLRAHPYKNKVFREDLSPEFKAVLVLPKTAGSSQTHKSRSFIWIVWSTLYVYLWANPLSIWTGFFQFSSLKYRVWWTGFFSQFENNWIFFPV